MKSLSPSLQEQLEAAFRDRVSFDPMERKLYSHDVGALPALIKPLLGDTTAAAVVQPETEEELVALVGLAGEHGVPLVPRGKATSGYGGVLPVKSGIVVDFYRLRDIVSVDGDAMTVTVEPGVVWETLEKELHKQGLDLRLYPSSAPSSTVGGWLAQGGAGFGSFEYGWFAENVVSARVVLPTGQVREFSGDDLKLVADAEGITGFISQVTLRLRPLEAHAVRAARFGDAAGLAAAMKAIAEQGVPLWSVSFINPTMARLKNQAPPRTHHGHPVDEHRPQLPEAYIGVFVYPQARKAAVEAALDSIVAANGGQWLADDVADHEWEERFNLMKVKRLGPSLVPTEVVVPLDGLAGTLADVEAAIKQPLVMEGMIVGGREAILLGFIPHDERSFGYNLAFGLALSAIKAAKAHGGRVYASGLYFANQAQTVLGHERLAQLREFKAQVDPKQVMNPGKVLGNGLLGTFMSLAETFEPLVRIFGNAAKSSLGERTAGQGKRGIPDDVAWYAYACAQCGYCTDSCTEFYGRGWESFSPRGKWYFLRELMEGRAKMTQEWVDKFLVCTTCERCDFKCPLDLPIEPSWMELRGELIQKRDGLTFPPFEIMAASLRKEGNIWAAYRKDRSAWVPDDLRPKIKEQAEVAYFAGCTASYVEPDIAEGALRLLDAAGVEFTYMGEDESCCAIPMLVAGRWDVFEEVLRRNVAEMKKRGAKTVVTSCPACWLVWHTVYPEWAERLGIEFDFETKHYSELIAPKLASGELKPTHPIHKRVTWHDSCHIGRAGGVYEPPRELIRAVPGVEFVEMEHNREDGLCCGSVLTLIGDPPTAEVLGDIRIQEAVDVEAEAILALCPCCQFQLRVSADKVGSQMPVIDLAHFVAESLGFEIADPSHYTLQMWAVFENMVNMMTPEGMANMMAEMLPEMIEAMPGPFRGMMKMVKAMPGPLQNAMIAMMRPLMPLLFPMLMPGMMPKVLPDMLALIEKKMYMPDEMKEQMPDLMPPAMDKLMPKMLPMIIPHFMPKMEAYLRGESITLPPPKLVHKPVVARAEGEPPSDDRS